LYRIGGESCVLLEHAKFRVRQLIRRVEMGGHHAEQGSVLTKLLTVMSKAEIFAEDSGRRTVAGRNRSSSPAYCRRWRRPWSLLV
jgi:hypothetical protein